MINFIGKPNLTNDCVIGLGSAKLKGDWVSVRMTSDYLMQVAKVLKELEMDSVEIIFTKDSPIIFGHIEKDIASGIFVAPREDKE